MGVQFAQAQLNKDQLDETFEPSAIVGRIGASATEGFVFEGRIGTGVSNDSRKSGGQDVTVDVNYLVGGYGLLRGNFSETLYPYAIAGATIVDLEVPNNRGLNGEKTSLSYGVGFDARVSQALGLGVEYIRYISHNDFDLDGLSIGFTVRY
ncbi:hypothetical protein BBH56_03490 [Spiribacter roseus]|nr:hypothetical protein BBH56_03490 [Spiribacter roseus]